MVVRGDEGLHEHASAGGGKDARRAHSSAGPPRDRDHDPVEMVTRVVTTVVAIPTPGAVLPCDSNGRTPPPPPPPFLPPPPPARSDHDARGRVTHALARRNDDAKGEFLGEWERGEGGGDGDGEGDGVWMVKGMRPRARASSAADMRPPPPLAAADADAADADASCAASIGARVVAKRRTAIAAPTAGTWRRLADGVPHVRQTYNWDCGLACVLMSLRYMGAPTGCDLRVLRQLCPTTSVWTVDLAYLLRRFGAEVTFCTITLGANPEFAAESFYRDNLGEDGARVERLFACAAQEGICVERVSVGIERLKDCAMSGDYLIIALVDKQKLVQEVSCRAGAGAGAWAVAGAGARAGTSFMSLFGCGGCEDRGRDANRHGGPSEGKGSMEETDGGGGGAGGGGEREHHGHTGGGGRGGRGGEEDGKRPRGGDGEDMHMSGASHEERDRGGYTTSTLSAKVEVDEGSSGYTGHYIVVCGYDTLEC